MWLVKEVKVIGEFKTKKDAEKYKRQQESIMDANDSYCIIEEVHFRIDRVK